MTGLLVSGESMSPTLRDGAVALVDQSAHEIIDGKVYVVYIKDSGIIIKRLFRGVGTISLRSDNPDFPELKAKAEEIVVQGRIVGVSQEL